MPKTAESHRADIDGLRALAIIPVVFYHFKMGFPGGFVGVDVFFVISGFLICSLILKEQEAGTFSIARFWERRVRRIFPALAAMVFAAAIGSWLLSSTEDFCKLGASVISQALLLSNVYFYNQSLTAGGYFAPSSETRPLLHTWSLAVEEQFYFFFPVLLLFLARSRRKTLITAVALIGLVSLIVSVYQADCPALRSAAFYLLPARAWELLLGALLTMLSARIIVGTVIREAAGCLGVLLIGLAIFCYDSHTPFPGAAALPPCLGGALVIFSSATRPSLVGRILSWRPVVFVGLISYSLYLWHWPLLVFCQGLTSHDNGLLVHVLLIGSSISLAILSWRFVENPFRQRRVLAAPAQILAFGATATAILLALGLFIRREHGVVWRPDQRFAHYVNSRQHGTKREPQPFAEVLAGRFIPLGTRQTNAPLDVLLWGDSHALAITPEVDEICAQQSRNAALAYFPAVPPVLAGGDYVGGNWIFNGQNYDPARVVFDFIMKKHPRIVFMTAAWEIASVTTSYQTQLLATVKGVLASGARVYVMKDVPGPGFDAPRTVAMASLLGRDLDALGITPAEWETRTQNMRETFAQISQMGATVLDPSSLFLNQRGVYRVIKDDQVLYIDGNHLTVEGARLLEPLLKPAIQAD